MFASSILLTTAIPFYYLFIYFIFFSTILAESFSFPNNVYHEVCAAYGVPVVSVKDAIWPTLETPPRREIWLTKNGAHPLWSGHQLITDVVRDLDYH